MTLVVLDDVESAARRAADELVGWIEDRLARPPEGVTLALSGGTSPAPMLERLAELRMPWWGSVQVLQVDERMVPADHPDRNLAMLSRTLLDHVPEKAVHPLPVESADPVGAGTDILRSVAGNPPVIDVVVLGLGADGHTASLVPGDPVLDADDDLALTGEYDGHRRITLTVPTLSRARHVLWFVTGATKAGALDRLLAADPDIPATLVWREDHLIVADRLAAEG